MKTVPGQFPDTGEHAPIAFVGEAPSDEEMAALVPLVGPSGRVFNAMLRSAGIRRYDHLVTNLFDVEVPNEEAVQIWSDDSQEITRRNKARLLEELHTARPNVIVPLGGPALFAFTGQRKIIRARGAVTLSTELLPGVKLLPTFHPAFVIRTWKMFPVVVGDLTRAYQEALLGPEIVPPFRELLLEPTLQDIRDYMPRLMRIRGENEPLSVDIETSMGQISDIGFAPDKEHAINIPFIDRRQADRSYWRSLEDEVQAWLLIKQVLENPEPKLGQNFASYDLLWLWHRYGINVRNFRHDTRLLHHAIHAELPKDLAFLGASYTRQGQWKHWGKGGKRDD